jgi:uncharacterized protein (DUF2141 family)
LKKQFKYCYLILILAFMSCAKRGTINGGLKDTIPPILKISFPKNYTTDFKENTIKLTFDEYVKLKNVNKQLIVSPPMTKAPDISPLVASKTITIRINDTLQPNTTYSFNFGQSIEDNNEGNPYRQFKYVFSTGSYIDSLSLSGSIKDAYDKEADSFVTVMLYEVNDKYNDSIIYKQNPRYVTNTLDSAKTFKLENLKAGKYQLVALKDINSDYKFNPKTDKIGFHKQYITIPTDTLYEIELFKEAGAFKAFKPSQASGNRLIVGYEGNPKDAKFQLKKGNENLTSVVTKFPQKDSLQIWYKPIKIEGNKTDSLMLSVSKEKYTENFTFKIKNQKADTLSLGLKESAILHLGEKFTLNASIPLTKFDITKMKLTNKDSIAVAFTTAYDEMKMELQFDFQKEPLDRYKLQLLPGALTDLMEKTNDTLVYKFETKSVADYGNLRLTLENVRQFPVIIELTDKSGEVQYTAYSEGNTEIDFNLIKPALYTLRAIYDENKNAAWDSGSFLEKRQSEQVIYFSKEIDIRANWDWTQSFNLKP